MNFLKQKFKAVFLDEIVFFTVTNLRVVVIISAKCDFPKWYLLCLNSS